MYKECHLIFGILKTDLTNSVICALIVKKKNIMTGKQFIRKFRMKIFSGDVRAINY